MDDQSSPSSGIDAFRNLERWLSGQAAASAGMSELERESERRGREILRLALQAHIDARGDGDLGSSIVLAGEKGAVRLTHKRVHTRPLVTLFGEVRVTRVGTAPADARRSIPSTRSCACPPACGATSASGCCCAPICGPFDEAITLIAEMTGTTIPKRSAESSSKKPPWT